MGRKGYVMDVALLQQSFAEVKPQQEAFAEAFYRRLFALYPQTIPLFATTNMKRQQSLLMATLELVVAGVARGDNVIPSVEQLGRRHAIYGVKAEHYPMVGQALLETFKQFLQDKWTAQVEATWAQAYVMITDLMRRAGERHLIAINTPEENSRV
ncbi:MAG: flavohemoprotein [Chloroflexota bacterium]|nr:MAG: flavohemoprotein [Chloroflexota bacterium]